MEIPAGRIRDPRRLIWTGVLTLGIGFGWYYFRAFQELDFNAGRRHSPLYFLSAIPLAGPFFAAWYMHLEQQGLAADRAALGLLPGLTAGRHALWVLLGLVAGAMVGIPVALALRPVLGENAWMASLPFFSTLGLAFAAPQLAPDVNEVWQRRGVTAA